MQKRVSIALILTLVIFLSGCDTSGLPNLFGPGNTVISGKGIQIELSGYPQEKINENVPFVVKATISNYNNQPLEGTLCLVDRVPPRLGGFSSLGSACESVFLDKSIDIDGKVSPAQEEFEFRNPGYHDVNPSVTDKAIIGYYFKYIVNQKTSASTCVRNPNVDANTIKSQTKVSCSDTETLSLDQADLPIKVTKIVQTTGNMGNNQVIVGLNIYLTKNEKGEIIPESNVKDESTSLTPIVSLVPSFSGYRDIPFKCSSQAKIAENQYQMRQNDMLINCNAVIDMSNRQELIDNIIVDMSYGFMKSDSSPPIDLISSRSSMIA